MLVFKGAGKDYLSAGRPVLIAQVMGRVRTVESELVLAFGRRPGAGGAQHLARSSGRGPAMEGILSADGYDAELAERYGWVHRTLPAGDRNDFVKTLAHRIAAFP